MLIFLQAILLNALIPATKNIRLKNLKITSGSTPETGELMHYINRLLLRERICTIDVAEAAKVIENSQRDINIS
jgi:UDP-N-acetyl-D-galactosamine dehydrogenase